MKKTPTITVAALVLIALATAAALFTLNAVAGSQQTCGRVNPAELRAPADPDYATKLAKLARCAS